MVFKPAFAPVRPRIVSPETGDVLPLDETIRSLAEESCTGVIELLGERGAGKSTALAHLAAVLNAHNRIVFLDEPDVIEIRLHAQDHLVVFTSRTHRSIAQQSLPIAEWTDDDAIEYLLAAHPARCRDVMRQWSGDEFRDKLPGAPFLCRVILDQMANSPQPLDTRASIIQAVDSLLRSDQARRLAGLYCLAFLTGDTDTAHDVFRQLSELGLELPSLRLLGYRPVRLILAGRRIVSVLKSKDHRFPTSQLPQDLVKEVANIVAGDSDAAQALLRLLRSNQPTCHPMAASVCHAAGLDWKPRGQKHLSNGFFDEADWSGIDLSDVQLSRAKLRRANLAGTDFQRAKLKRCQLRQAQMPHANLESADLGGADLRGADLSWADAVACDFGMADLSGANLEQAMLRSAWLRRADLTGANLERAALQYADLREARIDGADFSSANFANAKLDRLPLSKARLDGACFQRARMVDCDLEFVDLFGADFNSADLRGAILTASVMRRASFYKAKLRNTGLADIDWEGADLRGADLTGCSFHMGSTRSGLVGSPYPGHGSRTGFYTDSYDEQHFKSPEEIRKANLCGANLGGAKVLEADFYLVDLRGAKYDGQQLAHFQRCNAILDDRG